MSNRLTGGNKDATEVQYQLPGLALDGVCSRSHLPTAILLVKLCRENSSAYWLSSHKSSRPSKTDFRAPGLVPPASSLPAACDSHHPSQCLSKTNGSHPQQEHITSTGNHACGVLVSQLQQAQKTAFPQHAQMPVHQCAKSCRKPTDDSRRQVLCHKHDEQLPILGQDWRTCSQQLTPKK